MNIGRPSMSGGMTFRVWNGCPGSYIRRDREISSVISAEKAPPSNARSAWVATGSLPGARPMPRSMRPGCSAARVWNASAIRSGTWFGSMIPPEPTLIRSVFAATCAIRTSGEELATLGRLWCSAYQTRT
jgi:hypothetical protein